MKMKMKKISWFMLMLVITTMIPAKVFAADNSVKLNKCKDSFGGNLINGNSIKESLILSTITLCLPRILENYQEKRQFLCQAATCHYKATIGGYDSTVCDKIYAYQQCVEIQGEIAAIPGINIVDHLITMVQNALANPHMVLLSVGHGILTGQSMLCNYVPCPSVTYAPIKVALGIFDVMREAQVLMNIFENAPWESPTDYCDGLDGIKSDLENILSS